MSETKRCDSYHIFKRVGDEIPKGARCLCGKHEMWTDYDMSASPSTYLSVHEWSFLREPA